MKHKNKIKSLGRAKAARLALYKNLTSSLLESGYVVTSEAKGKELRRFFEPLVTKAKGEMTLEKRRLLLSRLGNKEDITELAEIAKTNEKRPGGYLRLTKLPPNKGNGGPMVKVELVD